jgi:hypothetical protein
MRVSLSAYFAATPIYLLWVLSLGLHSLVFTLLLFAVSIANVLLYIMLSKPRQLFFADTAVLSRTSHAHRRLLAERPRAWRSTIGDLLRGTELPPAPGDSIVELNVWQRNEICEAIMIVFSPITAGLPLLFSSARLLFVSSLFMCVFLLVLVNHFQLAVEDQKLIGEDLSKTQRRAMQESATAMAVQQYSGQLLQRRAHYRQAMPLHGPGADLAAHFGFQGAESDAESEDDEASPELRTGGTPQRSARSLSWRRRPSS